MDFKSNNFKLVSLILGGLVLLILLSATISSSRENKRLKSTIKENFAKIESLEAQKAPLIESIKSDSLAIIQRDSIISALIVNEKNLETTLKLYKNENSRLKNDYINSSIDDRLAIFAELAAREDSIQ